MISPKMGVGRESIRGHSPFGRVGMGRKRTVKRGGAKRALALLQGRWVGKDIEGGGGKITGSGWIRTADLWVAGLKNFHC